LSRVDVNLIPDSDKYYNLGSPVSPFKNISINSLVTGDFTLRESDNKIIAVGLDQAKTVLGVVDSFEISSFIDSAYICSRSPSSGLQGLQGTLGCFGLQGIQGVEAQGIQGPLGPQGADGAQGVQGDSGPQGIQGGSGTQGPQGIFGYPGFDGAQGAQGFTGLKGLQGVCGVGERGIQGDSGPQGIQGIAGGDGAQGVQGPRGFRGDLGLRGIQGIQGCTGPDGGEGNLGDRGLQGFSIQGPDGAQGSQGIFGSQGFQGVQGNCGGGTGVSTLGDLCDAADGVALGLGAVGNGNVSLGVNAGCGHNSGICNVFIGQNAGCLSGSGAETRNENVYVGQNAGSGGDGYNQCRNIVIGNNILFDSANPTIGFRCNVIIGSEGTPTYTDTSYNVIVNPRSTNNACYNIAVCSSNISNSCFGVFLCSSSLGCSGTKNIAIQSCIAGNSNFGLRAEIFGNCNTATNSRVVGNYNTVITKARLCSSTNNFNLTARDVQVCGDCNVVLNGNTCIWNMSCEVILGTFDNTRCLRANVQTISSLSDCRDKTCIQDVSYGLDFVSQLRPVSFEWDIRQKLDSDGNKARMNEKDIGFIAQELRQTEQNFNSSIYTRLVYEDDSDRLGADFQRTYPIVIKAIQDLSNKIDRIKTKIDSVRNATAN